MRAVGVSYLNESGVPHFSQKARFARLELAKNAGTPRVHAKFPGCPPASAANTPPAAGGGVRFFEWQKKGVGDRAAWAPAGGDGAARLDRAHWNVLQSSTEPL